MKNLLFTLRTPVVIATHLVAIAVANELAFLLRFDGEVPSWARATQLAMLPWLLVIRASLFAPFGLYRGLWRYASVIELRNILAGVVVSSAAFYGCASFLVGPSIYPRSVILIDALIVTFLLGGLRLAVRLGRSRPWVRQKRRTDTKRLLIYGAGEAGASIVRDIMRREIHAYMPVGFVDDDRAKVGRNIHGFPVLGTRDNLRTIIAEHSPEEVLIAMPGAAPATMRGVVQALEPFTVRITTLPSLPDILDGTVTVSQIRNVAIEDLLPRAPVGLDETPLRDLLSGRRVLVTGAGGSIGSELCQQIMALRPESLVLYERSENALYAVTNLLTDGTGGRGVHPVLGDIADVPRLNSTMAQFRPEIVFHAAAHKHVPMLEAHPCEAVKNNVAGTRLLAEAAKRHGVARFIMISTDKAVNPTSTMGATKRVAELIVMNQGRGSSTTFLTVRFGNVLGSNGSAIPRFIDQIAKGGPITITHRDMRRYFMLLPEAAQLVLHVAGRGRRQGVYVLDMGEQIKVVEMARNLIRLSGFIPDEDIQLTYTGLRPGEKLFEELVGSSETVAPSSIDKVFEVTSHHLPSAECLEEQVRQLEKAATRGDASAVMRMLATMLPEYTGRSWEPIPDDDIRDVDDFAAVAVPHLQRQPA